MKNIQILDCTLRDGGRIINCKFENAVIEGITQGLANSGIDIVEIGFLRGHDIVTYEQNSTFFTETEQIKPFIPCGKTDTMYVAFIDFGMYDFSCLDRCTGEAITGIRVGFTKTQFTSQRSAVKEALLKVKEQGYKLFIQGVNTLAYTDKELLELVDVVNEIRPYSFGLVDTYGAMYLDDIIHYYHLIDYNLNTEIHMDIHTHNNFQLSFAFAQEIISLADGKRNIILDATLNGMGKCAGNLNTELIADFLIRKRNYDYDINGILDIIDRYLYPIKENCFWGYSIPAFMAGIYKAHPNNIIFLTEKYRLNSKDMKYIISSIDEEKRQRYDYDNIQRIYKNYCQHRIDDTKVKEKLIKFFEDSHVLILVPGKSVVTYYKEIKDYIKHNKVIVICVNFVPRAIEYDYLFYANTIHWEKISNKIDRDKCIITSNIHTDTEETNLIDYASLIAEDSPQYDNSTVMLLNFLKGLKVRRITIAGFDGHKKNGKNYIDDTFPDHKNDFEVDKINKEIKKLVWQYIDRVREKIEIDFLTPSIYEEI